MSRIKKIISQAPGRVCLFGEHQDYLGLPVIAAAINRYIRIEAVKNDSEYFNILMPDINQTREIWIHDQFNELKPRDYFGSSLRVLKRYGCIPGCGYDIEITGTIPINSGASSSSALVVAWVQLLLYLFGAKAEIKPVLIAKIAHEAEVKEHGEPGGMMDHFSISLGNIVFIETIGDYSTRKLGHTLDGLILADSQVPKETLGLLAKVKQRVNTAVKIIRGKYPDFNLQDAKPDELKQYSKWLPQDLVPYFTGAVQNHHITKQALHEFQQTHLDLRRIGSLMYEHQLILRDLLEISIPKIDKMIEAALNAGALGGKINGSGGGGSVVILAPGKEEQVCSAMTQIGAIAYPVKVNAGARIKVEESDI